MARKFVVSVVSTVVGAHLDALDRFFGFQTALLLLLPACANGAFSGAEGICILYVGKTTRSALTA
jgi:hypothetical protein